MTDRETIERLVRRIMPASGADFDTGADYALAVKRAIQCVEEALTTRRESLAPGLVEAAQRVLSMSTSDWKATLKMDALMCARHVLAFSPPSTELVKAARGLLRALESVSPASVVRLADAKAALRDALPKETE